MSQCFLKLLITIVFQTDCLTFLLYFPLVIQKMWCSNTNILYHTQDQISTNFVRERWTRKNKCLNGTRDRISDVIAILLLTDWVPRFNELSGAMSLWVSGVLKHNRKLDSSNISSSGQRMPMINYKRKISKIIRQLKKRSNKCEPSLEKYSTYSSFARQSTFSRRNPQTMHSCNAMNALGIDIT